MKRLHSKICGVDVNITRDSEIYKESLNLNKGVIGLIGKKELVKGGIMISSHYDIECPSCKSTIHVPFVADLEAKAIEDARLIEISSKEKYEGLSRWLRDASLFDLIKYWFKRK